MYDFFAITVAFLAWSFLYLAPSALVGGVAAGLLLSRTDAAQKWFCTCVHRNAQENAANLIDEIRSQEYRDARLSWEALKTSHLS
jgi:hypothetical protein